MCVMNRLFGMLVLLVGLALTAGCGKDNPVAPETNIVPDHAQYYADGLVKRSLSAAEVDSLVVRPLEFQWQVARHVFKHQGYTSLEAESLVTVWQYELSTVKAMSASSTAGACSQPVEYKSYVRDPIYPYMTTSFSSSRGTEYLYHYNPWWTVDSNNIRWGASDPLVYWAIWVRTSGSGIAGQNLCSKPFSLLLGNTTVAAAGGQFWVMANLYVHHL